MSDYLEIEVTDENNNMRVVIVTDWVYHAPMPARSSPGEWHDIAPEGAELYDIEAEWGDAKRPLTDKEWEQHEERIREAILDYIERQGPENDY